MAFMNDEFYDDLLANLDDTTHLYLCSQEPNSFAEASSTFALGSKASPSIGAVTNNSPNGRKRTVAAITDGAITSTGTATHWALVDSSNSKLLVSNSLSTSKAVANGNVFTLTAIDIKVPDAVSA